MIIDTHSHLDGPEFKEDLKEVIDRAKAVGVERILVPAINLDSMDNLMYVCQQYKDYLVPMIGLHPEEVKEDYQKQLDGLYRILKKSSEPEYSGIRFCAIGEIGLDFYWDETFKSQQIDAFEQQIQWAVEFNLPLMIHARKAHRELTETMEKYRKENRGITRDCLAQHETSGHDSIRTILSERVSHLLPYGACHLLLLKYTMHDCL